MKWDLFETVCFSRIHLCQGRFREWSVWPHLRCCVTWLIEVSWTPGLRPWDHFTRWPTSSTLHHLSISTVPYWSPQLWQSGLFKLLKKQLVAVGLGIKNLYICSKYVFIPVIQWRVSCWRTGGELWPSLFEISGRVGVFCRSLLGPFRLLRSWGLLWMLWRYCLVILFCRCWTSWRQSYHRWAAVLLSVFQLCCINISDLKG